MKKPKISIIIIARNEERFINKCISSILKQIYRNFEIIIIDDFSIDKTGEIISKINDKRIRYFRNKKRLGIPKSRNKGVKKAKGEFIFFTDADCIADKNWIIEGYKFIRNHKCLGVEGVIYYVSKNYIPTYSDKVISTLKSGEYMTANMVYTKSILNEHMFNTNYYVNSDRELALKILKGGNILFCKSMIIIHQKDVWTIKEFFNSAKRIRSRILLFKNFGERNLIFWRIVKPENLIAIIFPPLIFISLIKNRYRSWNDIKLFLILYPWLIYERFIIWNNALKEKIFLI